MKRYIITSIQTRLKAKSQYPYSKHANEHSAKRYNYRLEQEGKFY